MTTEKCHSVCSALKIGHVVLQKRILGVLYILTLPFNNRSYTLYRQTRDPFNSNPINHNYSNSTCGISDLLNLYINMYTQNHNILKFLQPCNEI